MLSQFVHSLHSLIITLTHHYTHRRGTSLQPQPNKKKGRVQQEAAEPGDTSLVPHSSKGQSLASVDIPLLTHNMLGPLGDLLGEGSSCFVRLAHYQGQKAAVKMVMCSRKPYEAALREATMYQVGTHHPFRP